MYWLSSRSLQAAVIQGMSSGTERRTTIRLGGQRRVGKGEAHNQKNTRADHTLRLPFDVQVQAVWLHASSSTGRRPRPDVGSSLNPTLDDHAPSWPTRVLTVQHGSTATSPHMRPAATAGEHTRLAGTTAKRPAAARYFGTKRPPVQIRPPRPSSQATYDLREWPFSYAGPRCRSRGQSRRRITTTTASGRSRTDRLVQVSGAGRPGWAIRAGCAIRAERAEWSTGAGTASAAAPRARPSSRSRSSRR